MAAAAPLSVVLIARNEQAHVGAQLDALTAQTGLPWELVFVDDASTDATLDELERRRGDLPSLTLLRNTSAKGKSACLLDGVHAARHRRLAFVDADDVVQPGYLVALSRALDGAPLVVGRLDHDRLNDGWVRRQRPASQQAGPVGGGTFLPWGYGCALGVDAGQVDLDQHLAQPLRWASDVGMCWSIQLAGHELGFAPDAVVAYRYRTRAREVWAQARGYGIGQVEAYAAFRDRGVTRRSTASALWRDLRVVASLLRVRGRGDLARWVRDVGMLVGRLEGCLRFRTLYP